ncbi:MAG: hypothetical protein QF521_23890 [Alphaproteobacteria bacterium]|jgi:hypothetical protein|nr:hypothetical protein [Alphaproteobacteria bacterium]
MFEEAAALIAHLEVADWDHDHLGTSGAILENFSRRDLPRSRLSIARTGGSRVAEAKGDKGCRQYRLFHLQTAARITEQ